MRYASGLYQVPIVGGHLTIADQPLSVSAFAVGRCPVPLSSTAAAPGQRLGLLACLDGEMRTDFPFFRSFAERGERLGGDVRLLAELAGSGACVAAKDVSMAGMFGSLAMLLEPSGCGVTVADVRRAAPARRRPRRVAGCVPVLRVPACAPRPSASRRAAPRPSGEG